MIMKPIHTATINGHPVRFFKAPLNDGRPDFPWHAVTDLMTAANLPPAMIEHFLRGAKQDHAEMHRTIATADGVVTVAPHPVAQGLLGAMVEVGRAPASIEDEYTKAIIAVDDSRPMGFEQMIAAYHRWSDDKAVSA